MTTMMTDTFKAILMVTFGTSIAVANIVAAKLAFFQIPFLGGVAVPAGFLAIGVAFLCSDLLAELYGPSAARRAVNGTVVALVVAWGLIYTAIAMPVAPFYDAHEAYVTTLSAGGSIVLASIVTTLVSQHVDVTVFDALANATDGHHAWVRNIGSTVTSQLVDTALFIVLGFVVFPMVIGGTLTPLAAVPSLIVGQYVVKVGVAALDTPVFYLGRYVASPN